MLNLPFPGMVTDTADLRWIGLPLGLATGLELDALDRRLIGLLLRQLLAGLESDMMDLRSIGLLHFLTASAREFVSSNDVDDVTILVRSMNCEFGGLLTSTD